MLPFGAGRDDNPGDNNRMIIAYLNYIIHYCCNYTSDLCSDQLATVHSFL